MLFLLLLACFHVGVDGAGRIVACTAEFCNPNWTPFENMVYALRGYHLLRGNPFTQHSDPGFRRQIFVPTRLNEAKTAYVLEDGITAVDLNICRRSMRAKRFTDLKSYSNYITSSASSGINLQIGTEREVTVGVNIKGVSASSKQTIPPPFQRAWGNSKDMKKLEKFFSESQGMLTTVLGKCFSYEMQLDTHLLPPFTEPFKHALKDLYRKANASKRVQETVFRRFIDQYGTHFLISSKMGAQFMHETRYSKSVRQQFSVDTLSECNKVSGAKIFGIQIEKDKSKCTSSDKKKLTNMGRENVEEVVITKGSRPTDIKDWATQKFTPIPLQFQLAPIINLFQDRYLKSANIKVDGKLVTRSLAIRKWFVPLYWNYCKTVGKECEPKTGCGYDDLCPIDTICDKSETGEHKCSEWSSWKCAKNCGYGTQKLRTRFCKGCSGTTEQYKQEKCRIKPCYATYSESIHYTSFEEDGFGKVHFLDRHYLNCPAGKAIRGFQLHQSPYVNDEIRYQYWCVTTQLPCTREQVINDGTYDGKGDTVYLDRQRVSCGDDLLSSFGLKRITDLHWYEYQCCRLRNARHCINKSTSFTYDGDGNCVYLDRQKVMCPWGYSMTGFQLERNSDSLRIRYNYRCCKVLQN